MDSAKMDSVDDLKGLMDQIFLDKVRRARTMTPGEKIVEGYRLFDESCQIMRNGIRAQYPEFDEEQVEKELQRRLEIARRIDEAGIYTDAGVWDD